MDGRVVYVVDNGGGSIKAGVSTLDGPARVPNVVAKPKSVARTYVGNAIAECTNRSRLYVRRPVSHGYVTNWNMQARVWRDVFRTAPVVPAEATAFVLLAPFSPPSVVQDTLQTLFDDMGFAAAAVSSPCAVVGRDYIARTGAPTALVLDAGFSFTHAVPIVAGTPVARAVRRLDLGGKALANYLKERITYTSLDLSKEAFLCDHIKDTICYVSQDYMADMEALSGAGPESDALRADMTTRYLLPDYTTTSEGTVLDPETSVGPDDSVVTLMAERIAVPEALFNPQDIGLDEAGIHELIVQAVAAAPELLHPHLFANVVPVGGSALFPGFAARLEAELRPLVDASFDLHIADLPPGEDPIDHPWHAAARFSATPEFQDLVITAQEFADGGYGRIESRLLDLVSP